MILPLGDNADEDEDNDYYGGEGTIIHGAEDFFQYFGGHYCQQTVSERAEADKYGKAEEKVQVLNLCTKPAVNVIPEDDQDGSDHCHRDCQQRIPHPLRKKHKNIRYIAHERKLAYFRGIFNYERAASPCLRVTILQSL
jgi:hypothetical protein